MNLLTTIIILLATICSAEEKTESTWAFDGGACHQAPATPRGPTTAEKYEEYLQDKSGPCEVIDSGKGFKAARCANGKYHFYSKTKKGCEKAMAMYKAKNG